jgi:hypothetical protein
MMDIAIKDTDTSDQIRAKKEKLQSEIHSLIMEFNSLNLIEVKSIALITARSTSFQKKDHIIGVELLVLI